MSCLRICGSGSVRRRVVFVALMGVLGIAVLYAKYHKELVEGRNRQARIGLFHLVKVHKEYGSIVGEGNFRNLYYGTLSDGKQSANLVKAIADGRWSESADTPTSSAHEPPGPLVPYHGFYFMEDPENSGAFFAIPDAPGFFHYYFWHDGDKNLYMRQAHRLGLEHGASLAKIGSPEKNQDKWTLIKVGLNEHLMAINVLADVFKQKGDIMLKEVRKAVEEIRSRRENAREGSGTG